MPVYRDGGGQRKIPGTENFDQDVTAEGMEAMNENEISIATEASSLLEQGINSHFPFVYTSVVCLNPQLPETSQFNRSNPDRKEVMRNDGSRRAVVVDKIHVLVSELATDADLRQF